MTATTTLQVYRLEKHRDATNEFKHYTGFSSPVDGFAFFGYSRIGASWQWSVKGQSASSGLIVSKQLNTKRSDGYDDVWSGEITVPLEWVQEVKRYGYSLQQAAERARMEGTSSFGTGVEDERKTPLADVIGRCRDLVSKMADNPDDAVVGYAALVAEHEEIAADVSVVESYIDTLQMMLIGAGKGAA